MTNFSTGTAIIGAGNLGIATAYYLMRNHGVTDVVLIDQGQPMAFTSAQSGENYRDWWPHPCMVRFMSRSLDLMEEIAGQTDNRIAMTRRGYLLATRADDIGAELQKIDHAFEGAAELRVHDGLLAPGYRPPLSSDWRAAPIGFDILSNPALIRAQFPHFDPSIKHVIHVRRAGDIAGQQLGQIMLEQVAAQGGTRITGMVRAIAQTAEGFTLSLSGREGMVAVQAERVINAAGPFAGQIAAMLDVTLPIQNVVQQKIAFPDVDGVIPRRMPFAIDLDGQQIDWTAEEREALLKDAMLARLAGPMPGAIHCRPDGGDHGRWVKLGWAYNAAPEEVSWTPTLDPNFPEIVLRGASRLNPGLRGYVGRLPRQMHHYGGYYTRTADNWPLIGPMGPQGAFMAAALSGHGTMAACATGELAAAWAAGAALPAEATTFTLDRFAADRPQTVDDSGLL